MSAVYASPEKRDFFDFIFTLLLILICSMLFSIGYFLEKSGKQTTESIVHPSKPITAQLIIEHKPEVVPEKIKSVSLPVQKKPTVEEKKKTVDLTEKPVLAQKQEAVIPQQKTATKPVRRVFGLRKVYSQGLGAGGDLSDAVIGKVGNTIATELDTFTATAEEIKGVIVSTTTLSQAPRFKKTIKPVYSTEMLENRVEGVVKIKVLIDIDGKIKKAFIVSDIGFDSSKQALKSLKDMEFYPALRGDEAVASWIIIPIRFVMIS